MNSQKVSAALDVASAQAGLGRSAFGRCVIAFLRELEKELGRPWSWLIRLLVGKIEDVIDVGS